MSDTLRYLEPTGGSPVATEGIAITGFTQHFQVVKLAIGDRGSFQSDLKFGQVAASASLPVVLASDHSGIPVTAVNLDIRDLNYLTDSVSVSKTGNWYIAVTGSVNIRNLNYGNDSVSVVVLPSTTFLVGITGSYGSFTVSSPSSTLVNTTSLQILPSNGNRKRFTLQNVETTTIKINLGSSSVTQSVYHFCLPSCLSSGDGSGGFYSDDLWKGAVQVISSASGGRCVAFELT